MISAVGGAARTGGHGREGRLVGPAGRSHVKAGGRSMQDDGGEEGMTQLLSSHRHPSAQAASSPCLFSSAAPSLHTFPLPRLNSVALTKHTRDWTG